MNQQSSPIEQAAEKYSQIGWLRHTETNEEYLCECAKKDFIAGSQWQAKHQGDAEYTAEEILFDALQAHQMDRKAIEQQFPHLSDKIIKAVQPWVDQAKQYFSAKPKAAPKGDDVISKETILEKHSTKLSSGQYVFSAKRILEAMEEYASQFAAPQAEPSFSLKDMLDCWHQAMFCGGKESYFKEKFGIIFTQF